MTDESARQTRLLRYPPILRGGFRPFFLGGACWAAVVVALWLLAFSGTIVLPTRFDALAWHRHEMLFGYLGGIVAGFALTAIPNWTGRLPVAGPSLALLACLWLAARLSVLFSQVTGALPAFVLDTGFLAALAFVAAREILAARNRNLPLVAALSVFALAAALDHLEAAGLIAANGIGWRLGFSVVLLLIALIGGRIIPSFTRNWLAKRGETQRLPGQPGRLDMLSLAVLALGMLGWTLEPDSDGAAALLIVGGVLQGLRLARWSGLRTFSEPLVFVLHLAFAWLPIGLILLGASRFVWCIPVSAALHALSAGGMASMTLAVMTRATLGHTGRDLNAGRATRAIYLLVTAGAIVRFAAPSLPFDYMASIVLAGALWGGAFVLFAARYAGMLIGPRADGRA